MKESERILNDIEHFVVDIFEKQKELDTEVYADALPKSMLKKKDYPGHIKKYRELKDMALRIDTKRYKPDADDDDLLELVVLFEETLAMYNLYCDRGIAVQDMLMRKAMKEKIKKNDYMEMTKKQQNTARNFSRSYNDLTAAYADYKERSGQEV